MNFADNNITVDPLAPATPVWARVDQDVREATISLWMENDERRFAVDVDRLQAWRDIKEKLADRDVDVPDHPTHQTAQGHPENLLAFVYAIKVGGHEELLRGQDTSGKWEQRSRLNRERLRAGDRTFLPRPEWLPALRFLFPEVGEQVTQFLERNFGT
jgi:hypothetical protein